TRPKRVIEPWRHLGDVACLIWPREILIKDGINAIASVKSLRFVKEPKGYVRTDKRTLHILDRNRPCRRSDRLLIPIGIGGGRRASTPQQSEAGKEDHTVCRKSTIQSW